MTGLMRAVEEALGEGGGAAAVAVVGLAKNCGKTTTLKALIAGYGEAGRDEQERPGRRYPGAGCTIAVTSAGRDGEPVDAITHRPKPAIHLPAGTWIATAESRLPRDATDRHALGLATALGPVVVARTAADGEVELAGPVTADGMRRLREWFQERGVERLLIDGAMDRIAVAAPRAASAVVLAVGAVLGATPESVADQTAHWAGLLRLSPPAIAGLAATRNSGDSIGDAHTEMMPPGGYAVPRIPEGGWLIDETGGRQAAPASLLLDPAWFRRHLKAGHRWLVANGAVTDSLLADLSEARGLTVLAQDASRLLVSPEGLRRWRRRGGALAVFEPVRLAAITVNPHHPAGPDLDSERLLQAVAAAVGDLPVFDVMRRAEAHR